MDEPAARNLNHPVEKRRRLKAMNRLRVRRHRQKTRSIVETKLPDITALIREVDELKQYLRVLTNEVSELKRAINPRGAE